MRYTHHMAVDAHTGALEFYSSKAVSNLHIVDCVLNRGFRHIAARGAPDTEWKFVNHPKPMALVEEDVVGTGGLKIGGHLCVVATLEHGAQQSATQAVRPPWMHRRSRDWMAFV